MGRYRQFASENLIKNLTKNPVRVYCSMGGFVTFNQDIYRDTDPDNMIYICNTGSKEWLEAHGVSIKRLFFASCQGIGRDGKQVWAILPYDKSEPRLIPHGES